MRLIDADFEIDHYNSMLDNPTPDVTQGDKRRARIIVEALRMAPTIEAEPVRHGKWDKETFYNVNYFKCSICGDVAWWEANYCDHCGAKMDGGEE